MRGNERRLQRHRALQRLAIAAFDVAAPLGEFGPGVVGERVVGIALERRLDVRARRSSIAGALRARREDEMRGGRLARIAARAGCRRRLRAPAISPAADALAHARASLRTSRRSRPCRRVLDRCRALPALTPMRSQAPPVRAPRARCRYAASRWRVCASMSVSGECARPAAIRSRTACMNARVGREAHRDVDVVAAGLRDRVASRRDWRGSNTTCARRAASRPA